MHDNVHRFCKKVDIALALVHVVQVEELQVAQIDKVSHNTVV